MFKRVVQQGRSHFDARSVLIVREHGKMARTPLAAFFNIPSHYPSLPRSDMYGGHSYFLGVVHENMVHRF
jgi:hypothetical protein